MHKSVLLFTFILLLLLLGCSNIETAPSPVVDTKQPTIQTPSIPPAIIVTPVQPTTPLPISTAPPTPAPSTMAQYSPSLPPTSLISATKTPMPTPTKIQYLRYRTLSSFTTEAVKDVRAEAAGKTYTLPDKIVQWPYFARYDVVQNLDTTGGIFKIQYILTTANKAMAKQLDGQPAQTTEEIAKIDFKSYEGDFSVNLEPLKIAVLICPPDGILITDDRTPYDHKIGIAAIKE